MIKKIKNIVEQNNSKAGRIFDFTIQFLIILSLISFSIETIPELSESFRKILKLIEVITVVIFTIEYLVRLIVADRKIKFIFSFYGIIDLLAILPFYISSGIDLRSIRIFRLFRLFRALKLFRYSNAINRFSRALKQIKEELILFLFATCFLLFISAVGIYYFENSAQPEQFKSVFHCLWWAVATLTTVGYGDVYPITIGGKIFTFVMLIVGLGIIAVPTALIASALTNTPDENE
ncbi:MAG: ion transporter [Bacteroidales bacterium]|nr:ion transporter [Bacteroidales bacterium]